MQPWFTLYFFDIGHPNYDQLTPVKTRYPKTKKNKVSADQYHVTISRAQVYSSSRSSVFLQLIAEQVLVFSIRSRAHARLTY